MRLGRYFQLKEFTKSSTAAGLGIEVEAPDAVVERLRALVTHVLDPLREAVGTVIVTSGYRPPAINRAVGGASTSQHTLGEAADIVVPGLSPRLVIHAAKELRLPYDQIIDEYGRWTHVSYGPRHRRQVLLARSSGQGTIYVPSQ